MANVLGIIRNKASGIAGAVELFIDNVKQTQYKKCELFNNEWVRESTIPFYFGTGKALVYNNKIHVLSGKNHYAWDGNSWEKISTPPISVGRECATVYNNYIYVFPSTSGVSDAYRFTGNSWTRFSVSTFSSFSIAEGGNANNHFFGGDSYTYGKSYYIFNGSFTSASPAPPYSQGHAAVAYIGNSKYFMFGSSYTSGKQQNYVLDTGSSTWTQKTDIPMDFYGGVAVYYNGLIHLLGNSINDTRSHLIYNVSGNTWDYSKRLPISFSQGTAVVWKNKIHIFKGTTHYSINLIGKDYNAKLS